MIFNSFYVHSHPTPATKLMCCDKCEQCNWAIDTPYTLYCCGQRMRKATDLERKQACNAITRVMKNGSSFSVNGYDPINVRIEL